MNKTKNELKNSFKSLETKNIIKKQSFHQNFEYSKHSFEQQDKKLENRLNRFNLGRNK